jgi:hypothetical protein
MVRNVHATVHVRVVGSVLNGIRHIKGRAHSVALTLGLESIASLELLFAKVAAPHGVGWNSSRKQNARPTAASLNIHNSCDLPSICFANKLIAYEGGERQRCVGRQQHRPRVPLTTPCKQHAPEYHDMVEYLRVEYSGGGHL